MTETEIIAAYEARCFALASYAASRGLSLRKSAGQEIAVSSGSTSVVFPIVSTARDWAKLAPETAFYGIMLDAKIWKNVRLDSVTAGSPEEADARVELPSLLRAADAGAGRMRALASMLGGEAGLDALLANVETA